jgi:hypothetical protein
MAKTRSAKKAPEPTEIKATEPDSGQIAALAYRLWENAGHRDGYADEDWLRAEQILRAGAETPPASAQIAS